MNTEVSEMCFLSVNVFFMFNFFPAATEFVTVCHIKKQICQIWKHARLRVATKTERYEKGRPQGRSRVRTESKNGTVAGRHDFYR